jgi:Ca2+:H+ antiporter
MAMAVAIVMGAMLVNVVSSDGESTWYEGVLLLALYAILAMVFYVLPA